MLMKYCELKKVPYAFNYIGNKYACKNRRTNGLSLERIFVIVNR